MRNATWAVGCAAAGLGAHAWALEAGDGGGVVPVIAALAVALAVALAGALAPVLRSPSVLVGAGLAVVGLGASTAVLFWAGPPGAGAMMIRHAGAAAAGVGAALAVALAWSWSARRRRIDAPGPTAPRPLPPRDLDLERAHGISLVTAAAMLAVGEGAAMTAWAMVAVLTVARWSRGDLAAPFAQPARALAAAGAIYLAAALAGGLASGALDVREAARLTPWAVGAIAYLAVPALGWPWIRRAAVAFVAALTLSAGLGLVLYVANPDLDSWWLGPLRLFSVTRQIRVPGDAERLVAGGFYLHRLKLAHVLVLGIAGLVARELWGPGGRGRPLRLLVLGLWCVTLLLTFTRGALLGAAAGVGAVGLVAILGGGRTPKRARALGAAVAMALVVLGVLVGAVPTLRSRALSSLERQASTARAVLWSDALALLEQHPRGVGLGAYPELVRAIEDDTPSDVFIPPHHYAHNVLLTAWAEAGPLGLAATAWAWGLLVVLGASAVLGRGRAIARDPIARAAGGALLCAAVSFWVIGLTHDVLYHKPVALTFFAGCGAAVALVGRGAEGPFGSIGRGR